MSRKILMLCGLCVLAGCVVAMVKAQEVPTPTLDPDGVTTPAAGPTEPSSRRRSVLADRLRTARENVASEYNPQNSADSAPIGTRVGQPAPSVPSSGGAFQPVPSVPVGEQPSFTPSQPSATGSDIPVGAAPINEAGKLPSALRQPAARSEAAPGDDDSSRRTASLSPTRTTYGVSRATAKSIMLSSKMPALRVDTMGPGAITIGREADYEVVVANLGDAAAQNVIVSIDVPQWVEIIGNNTTQGGVRKQADDSRTIWTIDDVMPRGEQKLTLRVVPQENRPFELKVDWACRPAVTTARIAVQVPELELTLSGPRDLVYGETEIYNLVVSNPGTGAADNVRVQLSQNLGGQTVDIGAIAAGSQKKFDVELTAQQAGGIEVSAVATADDNLRAEAVEKVTVRRAVLEVTASGPEFKYSGSQGVYQLRIANTGDAAADDVIAAVAIPAGAEYLGGIDRGQVIEGGVRWNVGKLAPGAERVYNVKCLLITAGENRVEVGARGDGDVTGGDSVVTTVEALADLKLTVDDPRGPKPTGEEVTYEVTILNRGTKAASNVDVIAQFPKGIEPTGTQGGQAQLISGKAIFKTIDRIDAGGKVTLKVTAQAETAGNHVFRFEVKCKDDGSHCVSEGTTRFFGDDVPRTSSLPAPREFNRRPAPAAPIGIR